MKSDIRPGIAVVIPSWNNKDILLKCLRALESQTALADMEVIVADDGSEDGSAEAVRGITWKFPLKYLQLPHRGLAASSNAGIMAAEKAYILHIGSDIIAVPEMVEQHLMTHSENSSAAVIGYCPYSEDITATPFMKYLMNSGRQFGYGALDDGERGLPPTMFYTSNISFSRKAALDVGLFDEEMGWLYQDCEFGIRMIRSGVTLQFNKKALGYHHHAITLEKWIKREIGAGESLVKLALKHPWFRDMRSVKDFCFSFYYSIKSKEKFKEEICELINKLEEKPAALLNKLSLNAKEGHGVVHSFAVLDYHYDKLLNFYNGMGINNALAELEKEDWADVRKTGVWVYDDSEYATSSKIRSDMKKHRKLISIVVPVYNGGDAIHKTVESFLKQTVSRDKIELVLVDDGSNEKTKEHLSDLEKLPEVRVISFDENRGQSFTTNQGVAHSSGCYIMLSAQDILADRRLVETHLKTHEKAKDEIAVMGHIPYAEHLAQNKLMRFAMDGGPQFAFEDIKNYENLTPPFLYAPNITMKKEVFERVGGFDDNFIYGAQDTELGVRLRLNNIRIVYNPRAVANHNHLLNLDSFLYKRQPLAGKGMVQYAVKWPFLNNYEALKSNTYLQYIIYRENTKLLDDMHRLAIMFEDIPTELHPEIVVRERYRRNITNIPAYTYVLEFLLGYYLYKGAFEEINRNEGQQWHEFITEGIGRVKFFGSERTCRSRERVSSAILSWIKSGAGPAYLVDAWPDRKIYIQDGNATCRAGLVNKTENKVAAGKE